MLLWKWKSQDEEKRLLRIQVRRQERAVRSHQQARIDLEQAHRILKAQNIELSKKVLELEKQNQELERQRNLYRDMVFKKNVSSEETSEEPVSESSEEVPKKEKKKRGRQSGHAGAGRKKPEHVDEIKRAYLSHCPCCHKEIRRNSKSYSHTVEDLPAVEDVRSKVIRYDIEEQWCPYCQKKVRAQPMGVIPYSRLGLNLIIWVMIMRYGVKTPWKKICFLLKEYYQIKVSSGGLTQIMDKVREWFGESYDKIKKQIQGSPVKHADETHWRLDGINHWLWGFFTKTHAYYTIEESRGKGVPQAFLSVSHPDDVLVRDDYGAYIKLKMRHQSCWFHLLERSKQMMLAPKPSEDMKQLHKTLKEFYQDLDKVIQIPFEITKRKEYYQDFLKRLEAIQKQESSCSDFKKIQNRIRNQSENLLTAVLFPDVPLTNNLAERQLRPLVAARKVFGGSKSKNGAKTMAVNESVFETIKLQKQDLIPALKQKLLSGMKKIFRKPHNL